MYHKLCFGLVALLVSFLAVCPTVESRIKSNPQIYASRSPAGQALVRKGQLREGMLKAAVFLAWAIRIVDRGSLIRRPDCLALPNLMRNGPICKFDVLIQGRKMLPFPAMRRMCSAGGPGASHGAGWRGGLVL